MTHLMSGLVMHI